MGYELTTILLYVITKDYTVNMKMIYVLDKPPKLQINLKNTRCVENEPVSLVAEFDRKVDRSSVKWFFNGTEITSSNRDYSMINDGAICTLKLFNPTPSTSGEYTVDVEGTTSTANLTVRRKSNSFQFLFSEVVVYEDNTCLLLIIHVLIS